MIACSAHGSVFCMWYQLYNILYIDNMSCTRKTVYATLWYNICFDAQLTSPINSDHVESACQPGTRESFIIPHEMIPKHGGQSINLYWQSLNLQQHVCRRITYIDYALDRISSTFLYLPYMTFCNTCRKVSVYLKK